MTWKQYYNLDSKLEIETMQAKLIKSLDKLNAKVESGILNANQATNADDKQDFLAKQISMLQNRLDYKSYNKIDQYA